MDKKIKDSVVNLLRICLVFITVYGIGYASYCAEAVGELFERK
ncbi:hypothetical protein [Ligilactobacillus faecis]|nr:hypothetical protein [Ligilactobacillus faecis]WGN89544.1 hypothetical protein QFX10_00090 [Ligilactobacillus faecis]